VNVTSLENLYILFDRQIALTSAWTEDPTLEFVIRACRLKPADMFEKYSEKLILHHNWIDESGNRLEIISKKKIKIHLNDLTINRKTLVTTDLYENLPLSKISKISNLALFLLGVEEDSGSDHILVSFLGIDGFLRSFCYIYGELHKIPNLYLGYKLLKIIIENRDIKFFKELKIKESIVFPCSRQLAALSYWEPSKNFVSLIEGWNNSAFKLLNLERQ